MEDRARWISHLEFLRAFTRALRRGRLPVAYSQGYNPHARISFATARPVGMASEGEYVDVLFEEELRAEAVKTVLNQVFPGNIEARECRRIPGDRPSLASAVNASRYRFDFAEGDAGGLAAALERLLGWERVPVIRHRRGKPDRVLDIRPGILEVGDVVATRGGDVGFCVDLSLGGEEGVRPGELLRSLEACPDSAEGWRGDPAIRRIDIYRREGNDRVSPWCL